MRYFDFIFANLRFLGFGYLLAFSSTFGQTFYIAMYGEQIRSEFSLSHGDFGSVYALGTLAGGLLIIAVGNMIDRIDLRIYAPALVIALAGACLLFSSAQSIAVLTLAIFALRICGQGLMSQAATVTMARYFDANTRGRAVSIAALGFPTGQALFPLTAVLALSWLPWREVWMTSAGIVVLVMPITCLWMLRGHGERHASLVRRHTPTRRGADWTRAHVLRDPRFYGAMAAMLAPSFIITGLNFHQVHLVQVKDWDIGVYASSFAIYATLQVSASILTGVLVDRYGSIKLVPLYLLPLGCATLTLAAFDTQFALIGFMALSGASGGAGATIIATVWAELYGIKHLGSIKSLVAGLAVISSALAPATFGWLIDAGIGIESIAAACGSYALAGAALLGLVFRRSS